MPLAGPFGHLKRQCERYRPLRRFRPRPGSGQHRLVFRHDDGEVGWVAVDFVRRVHASMAARPG